jgi:hypothetical protein
MCTLVPPVNVWLIQVQCMSAAESQYAGLPYIEERDNAWMLLGRWVLHYGSSPPLFRLVPCCADNLLTY